ncbi:hypothetical protein [Rhizobium sp. SSA_523]|nr:hypothetical protein [Rhizobium sp. SSA_523]MCO5730577.1 hypothetical protein [Rhizobium sp. SSA_523]
MMKFKLALGMALGLGLGLGLTCAVATAEARSDLHLYGAVPIAGDRHLTIAYNNAQARCSLELYGTTGPVIAYDSRFGAPALRGCLSRHGFTFVNDEPYAYPVRKVFVLVK